MRREPSQGAVTTGNFVRSLSVPWHTAAANSLILAGPNLSHADPTAPSAGEEDDPLDFFGDALLTIFDHVQPIHGEPSALYSYTPPPTAANQLLLTVRIPPQEHTLLYAHYVWSAGVRLADRIALGEVDVKDKTVLELGAGTGIPSFMSAREGAAKVSLGRPWGGECGPDWRGPP